MLVKTEGLEATSCFSWDRGHKTTIATKPAVEEEEGGPLSTTEPPPYYTGHERFLFTVFTGRGGGDGTDSVASLQVCVGYLQWVKGGETVWRLVAKRWR